ncbi:snake venom 5'-nucleotidase-like [Anarrhichthys ocellatus]|uniref:snake venom 5'-nucleotidase-like n=1 Tax=Anarrhichthys ocellatus TaxID=433405 RepID=UPI0012EE26E3|nr:snake venom 5'-nucleotidase-like [Anarrhichthys ocellatus]
MRLWTPRCALLTSLCLFLNCSCTVSTFEVTLLHTNDNHARIEETSGDSGKCSDGEPCFAGVARRFTKVKEIREKEKNVLFLDAGDQFQGTVWFNYYKGAEAAHFMNKLGYDAMAFGNHEFDNGVEGLIQPFLQTVNCSVVSANIKPDQTLAEKLSGYYQPYTVINVGSESVAVVGYTTTETPFLSMPGQHLKFEDEVEALQVQVDKLETLGYNKIIALGHSGFDIDQDIAKRVRGVDVVIGGHTNTFLYTGKPPSTEVPAVPYPFMVRSDDGRNVPVVQAYAFGKYLGYLKVTFDKAGNVVKAVGNPILMDSSIPQDPDVLADIEKWKKNLAHYSSQHVGQTLVYLNGTFEECRFRECNLGNLICDAMIYHNIRFSSELQWNHVGMCMLNSGSVRSGINEHHKNGTFFLQNYWVLNYKGHFALAAVVFFFYIMHQYLPFHLGSITMEEIFTVLPFGGTVDLVQIKGSTVKKAFEHSIHRYGGMSGEFLQVSGIHVQYDLSKPVNQRVASVSVLCTKCRVPKYEPLDPEKNYTVVMPSYMVGGGDGFTMIKEELLKHTTGDMDISVFSKYISDMKRVYPAVEGRITFRNSAVFTAHSLGLLLLSLYLSLNGKQ